MIFRFAKFEGGKDDCMFPYCREVIFMVGQVEKVGEVANAQRTNMLEFVNGVSICTRCSGVRTEADGILNVGGSERCCIMVKKMVLVCLAEEFLCCTVESMG